MDSIVQGFVFDGKEVRFVNGLPVANDVAIALGYAAPAKTISTKVSEKNKGLTEMVTPGGTQSVTVLKEAGIYQLIFSSKLESAKRFQDWVFEEVLPSIRKTGSYSVTQRPNPVALPPRDTIEYVEAAVALEAMPDSTLKALLRDSMVDEICLRRSGQQQLIAGSQKQYTTVKIRAKQIGYSLKEIGDGSALGRFVHKRVTVAYQEMVGRYPVYHYEITPELDTAIHTFFGA